MAGGGGSGPCSLTGQVACWAAGLPGQPRSAGDSRRGEVRPGVKKPAEPLRVLPWLGVGGRAVGQRSRVRGVLGFSLPALTSLLSRDPLAGSERAQVGLGAWPRKRVPGLTSREQGSPGRFGQRQGMEQVGRGGRGREGNCCCTAQPPTRPGAQPQGKGHSRFLAEEEEAGVSPRPGLLRCGAPRAALCCTPLPGAMPWQQRRAPVQGCSPAAMRPWGRDGDHT